MKWRFVCLSAIVFILCLIIPITGCGSKATSKKATPEASACYAKGKMSYNNGEYEQAIADYTTAIELDPNMAMVYNDRGLAYQKMGNIDQAIADYSKATQLDRNMTAAYYNKGMACTAKGDYSQAIKEYTVVIALAPDNASLASLAYFNRGMARLRLNQFDSAIYNFQQVVDLAEYPNLADYAQFLIDKISKDHPSSAE